MRTGIKMKNVSKLTDARRMSREKDFPLLGLYTGIKMKNVSKLTDARRMSSEKGFPLLDCTRASR